MRRPVYLPFLQPLIGDRSGLQPPLPARPIFHSTFRSWSASLALPTLWPIMPSADFCIVVRASCGVLSPEGHYADLRVSPTACIATSRIYKPVLDGYGLRGLLPARPTSSASYPISVRRVATLLHASFRQFLTVLPLRFASASPPSGCTGDFHPQAVGHVRHTGCAAAAGCLGHRAHSSNSNSRRITPSLCSDLISDMDSHRHTSIARHGHKGQAHCSRRTLSPNG